MSKEKSKTKDEKLDLKKVAAVLSGTHEKVRDGLECITRGEYEKANAIFNRVHGEIYALSIVIADEAEREKL